MTDAKISAAELAARYERGERVFRGAKLRGAKLRGAKLSGANLFGADFTVADLSGADLSGADLSGADLRSAELSGAELSDANLSHADLSGAELRDTNLSGANLFGAELSGAYLRSADLSVAELSGAHIGWTTFGAVDLSVALGLEMATHIGPSTIGIDTIYASKGKIPESFLRGCGVPDSFITYMASLVSQPFEFYSCFISYSSKDEGLAKRLHARLQQEGLRVWFAPEEMKGGRKLEEQIDEAIRLYDKLLLVLSPHSMASAWVRREIKRALEKERREKRRVLFPIRLCSFDELRAWECLNSDTGVDMAEEIRTYYIPPFESWKDHDAFEASVTRLIKDLRAEARGAQAAPADAPPAKGA